MVSPLARAFLRGSVIYQSLQNSALLTSAEFLGLSNQASNDSLIDYHSRVLS